jgi:hypothetical protein
MFLTLRVIYVKINIGYKKNNLSYPVFDQK